MRPQEFPDRFEILLTTNGTEVVVSVDKPVEQDKLTTILEFVSTNLELIYTRAEAFFLNAKDQYGLSHLNDLSDPQITASSSELSLYWSSDQGEATGASVIGVDFEVDNLEPLGLTIGD